MTKRDVVRQYRDKHPDFASKKLARIIYKKESALFPNEETVRSHIRAIEGKCNPRDKATHKCEARPYNPYKLPESDETVYEPYLLKHRRIAIISDVHVPYHNIAAITAVLDALKNYQPDCLLINGDFFDFHGMSRFLKDPRKKNFADEIRVGCQLLQIFKDVLKCPIYFKLGNHDERYQHYLWTKLGEIGDLEDFELSNIINKRVNGITIIDGKRIIKAGHLNILHGHEFGGSVFSPVNVARGFYMRAKETTIGGHHHRVSTHTEKTATGHIIKTWSMGCLCELSPEYLPINSWSHGYATVDVNGDGSFHVNNYEIYKGKVL
jgi:predicted phosphodiesterase